MYKYSDQQIASRQFLNGVIMGWGRMSEYGPLSNTLMNAAMPVVDNDVCLASLLLNGAGTSSEDFSGIVCAHHDSGTVDSCEGDSGGPLMFTTDPAPVFGPDPATRYYHVYAIAGIVSFGKRCEENGEYGAYTRVSQYTGWLAAQVRFTFYISMHCRMVFADDTFYPHRRASSSHPPSSRRRRRTWIDCPRALRSLLYSRRRPTLCIQTGPPLG